MSAMPPAKKSLFVTYLLWFFGGFFGLHHFYLGRDTQAFLYWCTLGGYLGIGWLRDLFYIPRYVGEANGDPKYLELQISEMQKYITVSVNQAINEILLSS